MMAKFALADGTTYINQIQLLVRNSATRNRKDRFLPSFIFLLASCFSFLLNVVCFGKGKRQSICSTIRTVQELMTDFGK